MDPSRKLIWPDYPVLGIESSCDETAAAVIVNGSLRSNVVHSQIDIHAQFGGVVPEVASRAHVDSIVPVISQAMDEAGVQARDVGGIAVTNRPGLMGSLSVGLTAAKSLSLAWSVPLIGIHHLEGHLLSILDGRDEWPELPLLSLIVSGGHTELVRIDGVGNYRIVCETLDDAAGEAFDKSARLLGLGYPGGKLIQDRGASGNPRAYSLPHGVKDDDAHFSFSGLKTAVLRLVEAHGASLNIEDAAASVQEAVVGALAHKVKQHLDTGEYRSLALVGGVAANQSLRNRLHDLAELRQVDYLVPDFSLCTDNAGMIAIAGSLRLALGQSDDLGLDCLPQAPLPS